MACHAKITQNTGAGICFCDPHSLWQRGANKNINGLVRQYLPKGTDLSVHSQTVLDEIALALNMCPCKRFEFRCPVKQLTKVMLAEENKKAVTH